MSLVTGTPIGNLTTSEDVYIAGAPNIYVQDYSANPRYNPDAEGFYWGLSGTTTYPVIELGCPLDVSLTENLTINDVRCDNVGVKDTVQQRNFLEFTFTIQSFFPSSVLSTILKGGTVTKNVSARTEKFGLGVVDNAKYWMVYAPRVYDEVAGDYIMIHLHKAKFVEAFTLNMPFGSPWQVTGVRLRAFADTNRPSAQRFATVMRSDASAIT